MARKREERRQEANAGSFSLLKGVAKDEFAGTHTQNHSEKDGKRRCYTCGSAEHLAPDCPRKGTGEGSTPKPKASKMEGEASQSTGKQGEDGGTEAETMKGLIEESNKMLRSLTSTSSSSSS